MPDVSYGTVPRQSGSEPSAENKCTDAVCINASRIYDSCGSKDCLSNLDVFLLLAISALSTTPHQ